MTPNPETAPVRPFRSAPFRIGLRLLACALILMPIFSLLGQHLSQIDRAELGGALRAISLQSLALAGLFTAISLFAVARYDVLAIRQMGLAVPRKAATQSGFVAVSLGQTLGFGLIVGAICRWRFLRRFGISAAQAGLISGIVTLGFLSGFAMVLAAAVMLAPAGLATLTGLEHGTLRWIALGALTAGAGFVATAVLFPRIRIGAKHVPLPKLKVIRAQILLAALDTIPAAAALWVLIPSDLAPSLLHVIPVYLAALGFGLISNAPGGLGVLELTCLMALPVLPPEHLLAALIAYRVIYYGIPAVIAGAMLVARELFGAPDAQIKMVPTAPQPAGIAEIAPIVARSPRADAELAFLGDKSFLTTRCGQAFVMYAIRGNSLVVLGEPVGPEHLWPELLAAIEAEARQKMISPCWYKTNPAFAALLRGKGNAVVQIAAEAVVDLATFSTSGSAKRELRRKLKFAAKLSIAEYAPGAAPLEHWRAINAQWAEEKGGERTFSMGHFEPGYLRRHLAYEARLDGVPVAFLTVWRSGDEREHALDIMRVAKEAPDGTMHALVHAAIEAAQKAGADRFSLSAVPLMQAEPSKGLTEKALHHIYEKRPHWHGSHGLYRFKNAFRPAWEARFAAAPGFASAVVGAADVSALIQGKPQEATHGTSSAQDAYEWSPCETV